jgi:hypothetical protein
MKLTASSLLAAAVLLAGVPAASAATVITSYDEAAMDSVLAAVGASAIEKITVAGDPARNFTLDGINYTTALRGCKEGRDCPALLVQCIFTGETFSMSSSNAFNLRQTFAVSAVSPDRKSLFMGRLSLARGGTTVANATESFKAFFTMPPVLRDQVIKDSEAPVAAVQTGATPVATSAAPAAVAVAATPGASASADAAAAKADIWIVGGTRSNSIR